MPTVFDVSICELRAIEDAQLQKAEISPVRALHNATNLNMLQRHLHLMAQKKVIPPIGFHVRREIANKLRKIGVDHARESKEARSAILDHKIEALNDAIEAIINNNPRLDAGDRVAIAALIILLMAPSRINEPLCCSSDDHVTVEQYVEKMDGSRTSNISVAHQRLILTMKGSKGAQWSAKPALNFMINAFHYARDLILLHGQRSRMLVEWYEIHPDTLYLPPELEYLRGQDLDYVDLARVRELSMTPRATSIRNASNYISKSGGRLVQSKAGAVSPHKRVLPFETVEREMLLKVGSALEGCRRVSNDNHYQGRLSKMLFLFDSDETPYLPSAFNYQTLRRWIKLPDGAAVDQPHFRTVFEKLGITMPVNGKVELAWIDTHDPRRWLTTMALKHGENLSEVLINKWTNRLKLNQLGAYDYRNEEDKAKASAMPEVTELADLSDGLTRTRQAEHDFGLRPLVIVVNDAQVSITSMKNVRQAVEARPVAQVSNQIIILYPNWYGICLHQHHEKPCRRYNSCLPCDNHVTVKGDESSNQEVRKRKDDLFRSILRQVEALVITHNRGIADEPESLAAHITTLATQGLNLNQMADWMIDEFHAIRDIIKDKRFAHTLQEAFVAKGTVRWLDDPKVVDGAIIKYHNPTCHEAPGMERAINVYGGPEVIERNEQALIAKYPQLAPKLLTLDHAKYEAARYPDDDNEEGAV